MKLIDASGRTFQYGLIAEVPSGNLVWVDAVNGLDAHAVRGRMTLPFKTLTAAKNAAQSGDTIMVLPGIYHEKNLLKDGVNWHFMNGAIVRYEGSSPGGIFDTGPYGSNSAITSAITGLGVFEMTHASSSGLLYMYQAGSHLSIEAKSLSSVAWCILITAAEDASLKIKVTDEIVGTVAGVLYAAGGGADVICTIQARRLYAASDICLHVEGGSVEVVAKEIISDTSTGVDLLGGTFLAKTTRISGVFGVSLQFGAVADIEADEIIGIASGGGNGALLSDAGSILTIRNCRIVSEDTAPVLITNGTSPSDPPDCRLWNCFLRGPTGSYSIEGTGHVGFYGQCSGNHDLDNNIVPIPFLAQFVEDAPMV